MSVSKTEKKAPRDTEAYGQFTVYIHYHRSGITGIKFTKDAFFKDISEMPPSDVAELLMDELKAKLGEMVLKVE